MRIGFSQKIFLVFFAILAFTLAMSVAVYVGISGLLETNRMARSVKDLQGQLMRVETLAHNAFGHETSLNYGIFNQELQEVLDLGRQVEAFQPEAGREMSRDLKELPLLVDYYRKAYEELFERKDKGEAFLRKNDVLIASLGEQGKSLGSEAKDEYYRLLSAGATLHGQTYHDHSPAAIKNLKYLLESMGVLDGREETARIRGQIVLNVEESYLNYLAVEDRREFLGDTMKTFSSITGELVRSIDAEADRRQESLRRSVFSILIASILATLTLWFLTTRYTRLALGRLGSAISSIREEQYDYDTEGLPQDEFGDLGRFLKEMSLQLQANIESIRRGEQFLQNIIDGIDEPIMLIGRDYRIRLMNRKALEVSGSRESGIGRLTCHEVSHGSSEPCSGDDHPCPLLSIFESGETVVYHHIHHGINGEERFIEIVASPLFGSNGSVEAVIEANRDITDRKKAEIDLREAYEKLEAQNVELKKLDLIKDGLLRDVSHELKTPVAKYAMQLEILKPIIEKHKLSEAEKKALAVMEESLRRQEGVIKNLLDLARLEDGARKFRREPLRLDELIGKVGEDYHLLLDQYGGEITVTVPPITIRSDGEMLWHLFSNLLSNAIKFRKKEGRLRISLSAETVDGHVTVHVADEGEGFSEEEREQAFERFFQSTASNEGSGVGLTICKMIVDGLGGRISIQSEGKDRGAVVSVTLPAG